MPNNSLLKTYFPERANSVFYCALLLGMLGIIGSTILSKDPDNAINGNALFSFSIALILAAFGSQATIRIGSYTIVGAAAIGVLIFWFTGGSSSRYDHNFIEGQISHLPKDRKTYFDFHEEFSFLGNLKNRNQRFHFVILNPLKQEEGEGSYKTLEMTDALGGSVSFVMHSSCLEHEGGGKKKLNWRLGKVQIDEGDIIEIPALFAGNKMIAIEGTQLDIEPCRVNSGLSQPNDKGFGLLSSAYAQNQPQNPSPKLNWQSVFDNLAHDNAVLREQARKDIVVLPPDAMAKIFQQLKSMNKNDKRYTSLILGVAQGTAIKFRKNRNASSQLKPYFDNELQDIFVKAIQHPNNRTLRIHAAEVLVNLNDAAITRKALNQLSTTNSPTGRYNLVVIAIPGWNKLSAIEKNSHRPLIERLQSQTNGKTRQLLQNNFK